MSLINEALKRSEAERRARHSADSDAALEQAVTVKVVKVADEPKKPVGSAALLVVCIAALLAAVYAGATSSGRSPAAQPEPVSPPANAPRSEPGKLAKQGADQHEADRPGQADLIVASTLRSVDYYDPAEAAAANTPAAAQGARQGQAEAAPDAETLTTPIPSAEDFKLSAIIRGPDGATAIINGRFVKIGGTVGGATLVKLGRHTAELEIHGHRLVIQM